LLGDSFAFGWGVNYELSFAGVLQQLLQERGFAGDKKIEIIDAGVPGILLVPQLTWFDHVGKDYAPDLVIQVVYQSLAQDFNFTEPPETVNESGIVPETANKYSWIVNEDGYLTTYPSWYESPRASVLGGCAPAFLSRHGVSPLLGGVAARQDR